MPELRNQSAKFSCQVHHWVAGTSVADERLQQLLDSFVQRVGDAELPGLRALLDRSFAQSQASGRKRGRRLNTPELFDYPHS